MSDRGIAVGYGSVGNTGCVLWLKERLQSVVALAMMSSQDCAAEELGNARREAQQLSLSD